MFKRVLSNCASRGRAGVVGVAVLVLATTCALFAAPSAQALGATATSLQAALALQPASTVVGHTVAARANASTIPAGDTISKIALSWGDGSATLSLASLSAVPTHRYSRPGTFPVNLTITDRHGVTSTKTVSVVIATPAGRYSGTYSLGGSVGGLSFYVSRSRAAIEDVSANVSMTCSPGNTSSGGWPFVIDSIPLPTSGVFSKTVTRTGNFLGNGAQETFKFQGRVQGLTSTFVPKITGSLTETLTYNNGVAHTCTSSALLWNVKRDSQPSQPTTVPPSGSYSGHYYPPAVQGALSFYVSPDRTAIQDVSANVSMRCSPGNASSGGRAFVIDSLTLPENGSFIATVTRAGQLNGNVATETFKFAGHVQGVDASGVPRMAGSLIETLTYAVNDTTYSCTSEKLTWYVARDAQPSPQPTTPPPDGSYAGHYYPPGVQGALSFSVTSGGTAIADVSANVSVRCAPNGPSIALAFVLDSITLPASGAFATTAVLSGAFQGHPLAITVDFRGHVHGQDKIGHSRLAGSVTETASYTANSTPYTCTSETLPWYAVKS